MNRALIASLVTFVAAASTQAAVVVSEVHPTGSSAAAYSADWFEVTNTGASPVSISAWTVDDSSDSFGSSLALTGVSTLGVGESAIFLESAGGAAIASFKSAWFGATPPSTLQVGYYSGSGIGLSSGGDAVNLFDSGGALQARVAFGAATTGTTFDNAAGANNVTLTTLSAVGTNGGFTSATGGEIGSPGRISTPSDVPEPTTLGLAAIGGLLLGRRRRA